MEVNEQIAVDHGLKKEEYKKICDLLKRLLSWVYFLQCGMNTVPINHQDFI